MKKIYIGLIAVLGISILIWAALGVYSMDAIHAHPTQIEFTKTEFDFGKLQQGIPKKISFYFKNTGDFPLLIQHVETSCGCTRPQWPKYPVKPGKSAEIKLSYDAKKAGRFLKTITVFCNTKKGMHKLKIKGEVQISANDK
jgi:hypothetical protein